MKRLKSKQVFGTSEWAKYNMNCMNGCEHDCIYCYAKVSAKRRGITNEMWPHPTKREGATEKRFGKRDGNFMYPTQHDIHPNNIGDTLDVLKNLLRKKNNVLIVSKPHVTCIWAICKMFQDYKDNILFRFTIGSADDKVLKFWEPNAPDFMERVMALKIAYDMGFKTSISCEPMLDNNIHQVILKTQRHVTDSIWLGKMNFPIKRLKTNGHGDEETLKRANQLIEWQSDENIKLLYEQYKVHPLIKWKESIKKVVGIEVPTEAGLDV